MEASPANRHRENVGWQALEDSVIGLANRVMEKALDAAENSDPEKCLEWINAIHGAVALIERMNPETRQDPLVRALRVTMDDLAGDDGEEDDAPSD